MRPCSMRGNSKPRMWPLPGARDCTQKVAASGSRCSSRLYWMRRRLTSGVGVRKVVAGTLSCCCCCCCWRSWAPAGPSWRLNSCASPSPSSRFSRSARSCSWRRLASSSASRSEGKRATRSRAWSFACRRRSRHSCAAWACRDWCAGAGASSSASAAAPWSPGPAWRSSSSGSPEAAERLAREADSRSVVSTLLCDSCSTLTSMRVHSPAASLSADCSDGREKDTGVLRAMPALPRRLPVRSTPPLSLRKGFAWHSYRFTTRGKARLKLRQNSSSTRAASSRAAPSGTISSTSALVVAAASARERLPRGSTEKRTRCHASTSAMALMCGRASSSCSTCASSGKRAALRGPAWNERDSSWSVTGCRRRHRRSRAAEGRGPATTSTASLTRSHSGPRACVTMAALLASL
mmetsp:Transcript_9380/g.31966  ORF Transcript_9380/g.31966 Transcript_9380/m.31966 type:complete len:407 (+) Transcript_9380:826-2046(+)